MHPLRRTLAWALLFAPAVASAQTLTLSITDATVVEGDSGSFAAQFTVILSGPPAGTVTVDWSTVDCTAAAGSDYTTSGGQLTFAVQGPLQQTVSVPILGDIQPEGAESFGVTLSAAVNAALNDPRGEAVILDDDGPSPPPPAKSDFNGDGRSDIVVSYAPLDLHTPTRTIVWVMTGPVAVPLDDDGLGVNAGAWTIAGAGDLDLDGDPDVLWRQPGVGLAISLWDGAALGEPAFDQPITEPPGRAPGLADVGVADLDGDRAADLLLWSPPTGELEVWFLTGGAVAGTAPLDPPARPVNWRPVATGDFNADGLADLLWRDLDTGALEIWLLDGVKRTAAVTPTPAAVPDPNWKTVATGDFDGDGSEDQLWQHKLSQRLVVWLMDGEVRVCGGYLSPDLLDLPDLGAWEVVGPR